MGTELEDGLTASMTIGSLIVDASALLVEYACELSVAEPDSAALTRFPVASVMCVGEDETDGCGGTGLPVVSVMCVGDEVLARRVVAFVNFDELSSTDLAMLRCIAVVFLTDIVF